MSSGTPTRPSAVSAAMRPLSSGLSRTMPRLFREIACQHFDGAFHGGIRRAAGYREAGQSRGEIDDSSAVGEQRQQLLGQEEHALEVHVVESVEFSRGRSVE